MGIETALMVAGTAASAASGASSGKKGKKKAAKAAAQQQATQVQLADPFSAHRSRYAHRLNALMQDPGAMQQTPAHQFRVRQGMDALTSQAASRGLLGSGAIASELATRGQDMASQEYEAEYNRLANLAGAINYGGDRGGSAASQANQAAAQQKQYQGDIQGNIAGGIGGIVRAVAR